MLQSPRTYIIWHVRKNAHPFRCCFCCCCAISWQQAIIPRTAQLAFFFFFPFKSSGGWVKKKLEPPHFHVSDTHMCNFLARPDPCISTAVILLLQLAAAVSSWDDTWCTFTLRQCCCSHMGSLTKRAEAPHILGRPAKTFLKNQNSGGLCSTMLSTCTYDNAHETKTPVDTMLHTRWRRYISTYYTKDHIMIIMCNLNFVTSPPVSLNPQLLIQQHQNSP